MLHNSQVVKTLFVIFHFCNIVYFKRRIPMKHCYAINTKKMYRVLQEGVVGTLVFLILTVFLESPFLP